MFNCTKGMEICITLFNRKQFIDLLNAFVSFQQFIKGKIKPITLNAMHSIKRLLAEKLK